MDVLALICWGLHEPTAAQQLLLLLISLSLLPCVSQELEFSNLFAVLHCIHAFFAAKVACLDPMFVESQGNAATTGFPSLTGIPCNPQTPKLKYTTWQVLLRPDAQWKDFWKNGGLGWTAALTLEEIFSSGRKYLITFPKCWTFGKKFGPEVNLYCAHKMCNVERLFKLSLSSWSLNPLLINTLRKKSAGSFSFFFSKIFLEFGRGGFRS